jgi:hypothetical protein
MTPTDPLLPVVLNDGRSVRPAAGAFYVLAGDGLYFEHETPIFHACVRVDGGVPGLAPHGPSLVLRLPRLPQGLLERAVGFFRAVHDRCGGEAILLMFYAEKTRRFAFVAPPQVVSGRFERGRFRADLRLAYETAEPPGPGYLRLGTFHSHAWAGPRHSVIDEDDEISEPGLHLTAGYVNTTRPEFAAAFVVGRTRFGVSVADVLPAFRVARRPPAAWLEQVLVQCEPASRREAWTGSGWGNGSGGLLPDGGWTS